MDSSRLTSGALARALAVDLSPSALVEIDHSSLARLCDHIRARPDFAAGYSTKWDDRRFFNVEDPPPLRSQFLSVGNAVNFRYWHRHDGQVIRSEGSKAGTPFRGSDYMWRCLRLAVDEGRYPILDARFLANIGDAEFDAIFSDDDGAIPLGPGRDERILNLRDLGGKLCDLWGAEFWNLIVACGGSLIQFVKLSAQLRAYNDPCYKLTMVNAILHAGSDLVAWDADPLPGIDYQLLKQLLRIGLLRPTLLLQQKLIQSAFLSPQESYELRRIALTALLEISDRTGIPGDILDNRFFANRVKCDDTWPVCLTPETAHQCPFYGACEQYIDYGIPLELTRYY